MNRYYQSQYPYNHYYQPHYKPRDIIYKEGGIEQPNKILSKLDEIKKKVDST
ncbi:hypothetical protein [Litchfieldia alkalitelluris]|uniref:hypothetical protein n=1 Tax=Litchfieldia alkalitelluris TaxID=304268 RepID=UPI0014742F28|nr:hypothetical protein [Litchfieldia alkalitelluris]